MVAAAAAVAELIERLRGRFRAVGAEEASALAAHGAVLVDVRERDEQAAGIAAGAVALPRGFLEVSAERALPDKARTVVVYCQLGVRSLFAAEALDRLSYRDVRHLAGGFLAVGAGAVLGAWLRWFLGVWLNPRLPPVPLGTLAANVVGGYLVGIAVAWISARPEIAPEWRLFIVTGFLWGLTTFSTFSLSIRLLASSGEIPRAMPSSLLTMRCAAAAMGSMGVE